MAMELQDEDYKYAIQDFSNVYLGARMTYQDLADYDDVPCKIKDAVYRIFFKEVSPDTTIAEHLLALKEDSVSYMAYKQLRISIKVICLIRKTDKKGKMKETYDIKDYSLRDFMNNEELHAHPDRYMVQEISMKKRNMMLLHV